MKTMFCWRCQMDMPMLDEDEYASVNAAFYQGLRDIKALRQKHGLSLAQASNTDHFQPILDKYKEITGFEETVANAVMHHRISLYGPPCDSCGKPLRSPKALFCAACGKDVPGENA